MRSFFLARYRKHKKHLANLLVAASAAAGLAAGSAQATSIPITNAGFETNDAPDTTSYGTLTAGNNPGGWVSAGGGYIGYGIVHGGDFSGFGNGASTLTEILPNSGGLGLWAAGTYTLNGFGSAFSGTPSVRVSLRNGGTSLGSQDTLVETPRIPVDTALTPLVVTIASGDSNIGSPISVRITGLASESDQWYVDDITLDFTPAPEPGSLFLLSTGVSGLGMLARHRRRT